MRIVQIILLKLVSALVLLLGIALIAALFTDGYPVIDQAKAEYLSWPPFFRMAAWILGAVALVFIGFIGLMPWGRKRGPRHVSFAGPHGDVFYDLDSIEATINRIVGRMPEVKNIVSHVKPADDHRVEVSAEVVLNPTGVGARDAASLVSRQIEHAAEQMLGEDGVTRVVLHVKKILVDLKAPLHAPEKPGRAAAAAPSGHEAAQEIVGVEEAEREAEEERQAASRQVSSKAAPAPEPETAETYAYLPEEEEGKLPAPAEEPLLEDEHKDEPLLEDRQDEEPNLPPLESIGEEEEQRENPFR